LFLSIFFSFSYRDVTTRHFIREWADSLDTAFGVTIIIGQAVLYWVLLGAQHLCRRSGSTLAVYASSRAQFYPFELCFHRFPYLLVDTEALNMFYRLMGARIGWGCRILLDRPLYSPSTVSLGRDGVLARHAMVSGPPSETTMHSNGADVHLGPSSVISPYSCIEPGGKVHPNATVALLTLVSREQGDVMPLTTRIGSKLQVTLPQNAREDQRDGRRLIDFIMTWFVWPLHAVCFPVFLLFLLFTFKYPAMLLVSFLHSKLGLAASVLLCSVGFTTCMVITILMGIVVKWLLIQRVADMRLEGVASFFSLRYLMTEAFVNVGRYYGHSLSLGTSAYNCILSLLGSRVDLSKSVLMTEYVQSFDALQVGRASVGRDVVLDGVRLQETIPGTHCFQFSRIILEDNVDIGDMSVLSGRCVVWKGARLGKLTFLMQDHVVERNTFVQGCPAVKLTETTQLPLCGDLHRDVETSRTKPSMI
jgi:hypothetical protein